MGDTHLGWAFILFYLFIFLAVQSNFCFPCIGSYIIRSVLRRKKLFFSEMHPHFFLIVGGGSVANLEIFSPQNRKPGSARLQESWKPCGGEVKGCSAVESSMAVPENT